MNKISILSLFVLLLFSIAQSASGQSMSVTSGIGINNFFDVIKDEHLESDYGIGESYFLKIDFSSDQSSSLFSDFAIKLEKQVGSVHYSSSDIFCGIGFPSSFLFTDEHIEKYTISVITYPIKLSLHEHIRLKAGISAKKSLHLGAQSNYNRNNANDEINFESSITDKQYGVDAAFELQFGNFEIGNGLTLRPVYNAFVSLSEEFQVDYNTYSIRQSVGVSILWGLKKKMILL